MAQLTLKISQSSIQTVMSALRNSGYQSQANIAQELNISLGTLQRFLTGRAIKRSIFIKICQKLELDWQALVDIENQDNKNSPRLINLLHLSDLHFGTTDNARIWYAQLAEDLRYELGCSRLDALIISGDIASKSTPDEYAAAQLFINRLSQEFHVESQKIVIVPGNHDVNWQLAEAAYSRINTEYSQEGMEEYLTNENREFIEGLDKEQYKQRFINFSRFYEAIKGEIYPLEYDQQYSLQHIPEQKLLILGLNSAWQIDHRRNKYRASINSEALSNALSLIRRNLAYEDCLKIAVWHHSLNSIFDDRITDSAVMERLATAGFHLVLHGGIHRNENNSYHYEYSTSGQQINIIGAGVFGASLQESGFGYPWEYNFLKIEASKVTVETRRREDPNGVWKPDARWLQGTELNPLPRYVIPLTLDDADDPKIYVELGKANAESGRYEEAITAYDKAIEIKPDFYEAWLYRGEALANLGRIEETIHNYEQALVITQEMGDRSEQASCLNNLGNAYHSLEQYQRAIECYQMSLTIAREIGDRYREMISLSNLGRAYCEATQGSRAENIESAIAAYTSVLDICARESFPEQWAKIQYSLGQAYSERIKGNKADNLELSITAYNKALSVFTRAAFPEQWAMTQYKLGTVYAYRIHGDKVNNIEKSIATYKAALKIIIPKTFPYEWAKTQNSLGDAYSNRIVGNKANNIKKAITAYKKALAIFTVDNFNYEWARTQSNLGCAYFNKIQGNKAENLELAIACYQEALKVYTFDTFPVDWAATQNNLGEAYLNRLLGKRTENLELAITAYQEALKVYTFDTFPVDWAATQNNLGEAYLNRITGDIADNLEVALTAYQEALKIFTFDDFPIDWAATQTHLGRAFSERIRGDKAENLQTAIASYRASLQVHTQEAFPDEWARTCKNLGDVYNEQIHRDGLDNVSRLENIQIAITFYQDALKIYTTEQSPNEYASLIEKVSNLGYLVEYYQSKLFSLPQIINYNDVITHIEFIRADILSLEVDAIVIPINTNLDVGALGRQLHEKLGSTLSAKLLNIAKPLIGEIIVIDAAPLPANYLFLTPINYAKFARLSTILQGVNAALNKAINLNNVRTIAFPSVGTGALGLNPSNLAEEILNIIKIVIQAQENRNKLEKVIFTLVDEAAYQAYVNAYQMLLLETSLLYEVFIAIPKKTVIIGEEIEISVNLKQAGITENNAYILQIPLSEAMGSELNIILSAPSFQFNSDNATSLPLDPDTTNISQTANFKLTALHPGLIKIRAELYCGETYKTTLETEVEVTGFDKTELHPLIAARSRPVPQPDIILQVRTTWNADISVCTFNYHIDSYQPRLLFADDVDYNSQSLSATWVERSHSLLKATLEEAASSLREDFRSRLVSLGQYLFQCLLPEELQNTFRTIVSFNQPFTLLILADQDAWFPWELLHDGQKFLGDRFIIGRWLWELEKTRPYEFPVGVINVAHYANVEQPELWTELLQSSGAPPPLSMQAVIFNDISLFESIRGLHLIRYGQSVDTTNRQDAPVRVNSSSDIQDIESEVQPAKLSLRCNHPLVSLSYLNVGQPELTELEQTWASTFVRAGCSAFVGSLWAVQPNVEAAFVSAFYHSIWAGQTLGVAFQTARRLAKSIVPESLDWLTYVLFGDPMARPYRPVQGKGYAVVEPIGQEIDDPVSPGSTVRFRVSLRRSPPVWYENRLMEVAEDLTFDDLRVFIVTSGLQVTPSDLILMTRTATRDYLGWFTLTVPTEMESPSVLVQVYFEDGIEPVHNLRFALNIVKREGEAQ